MIPTLAESIYRKSVLLKKYTCKNLLWKCNRRKLLVELTTILELTDALLSELQSSHSYSGEYLELAVFMQAVSSDCMHMLTSKERGYREAVYRRVWGFHNLPKAFFSLDNAMKLSPSEALRYYKPYYESSPQ